MVILGIILLLLGLLVIGGVINLVPIGGSRRRIY